MLKPQQRLALIEENHVSEAGAGTKCLNERIAAEGLITRQRAPQFVAIVAILGLERSDVSIGKPALDLFRVAPFKDAGKSEILGRLSWLVTRGGLPGRCER